MQNVALITGGTGYLGSAIVTELERSGWFVAKLSRSSKEFPCDVTDAQSVREAVQKVLQVHGALTAVIHAATPPLERVPSAQASRGSVEQHRAVAVAGAQNLFNAVQAHMKKNGIFIGITTEATKSSGTLALGGYIDAKRAMEDFLKTQKAPFMVRAYSIGFLPGGLNADLPEYARAFFAARSEPLESVVQNIVALCTSVI